MKLHILLFFFNFLILSEISCQINKDNLEGCWHIQLTNFPRWTKPDISNPTFNYTFKNPKKPFKIADLVEYLDDNKYKTIRGTDKVFDDSYTKFRWRGKGLLFFVSSKWEIKYIDKDAKWMVIIFEKSLFSPAGIDVVSKEKHISEAEMKLIAAKLDELGLNSELSRPIIN